MGLSFLVDDFSTDVHTFYRDVGEILLASSIPGLTLRAGWERRGEHLFSEADQSEPTLIVTAGLDESTVLLYNYAGSLAVITDHSWSSVIRVKAMMDDDQFSLLDQIHSDVFTRAVDAAVNAVLAERAQGHGDDTKTLPAPEDTFVIGPSDGDS